MYDLRDADRQKIGIFLPPSLRKFLPIGELRHNTSRATRNKLTWCVHFFHVRGMKERLANVREQSCHKNYAMFAVIFPFSFRQTSRDCSLFILLELWYKTLSPMPANMLLIRQIAAPNQALIWSSQT